MEETNKTTSNIGIRALIIILSGLFIGLFLITLFIFGYNQFYFDKIYPGVTVNSISVGGMTPAEAEEKLQNEIPYPSDSKFLFTYADRHWGATLQELGLGIQYTDMVQKAWQIGRGKGFTENVQEQLSSLFFPQNIDLIFIFDERVAFKFISDIANEIDEPMDQPTITLHGAQVEITPGKSGKSVDRQMAMTLLQIYSRNLQTAEIELPVTILEPTANELDEQKRLLEGLLQKDFVLYTNDDRGTLSAGTIPADVLAGLINFESIIDGGTVKIKMTPKREPFYQRLVKIGESIYQKPQNARFVFNDSTGEIEPISEAVIGREIDLETSMANITESIQRGANQAEIKMNVTQPAVTSSAKGTDLGITELAHSEYTYFFYSDAARIQNIKTGAAAFHGLLVAPGETFSMAANIGEISVETGYADSSVIFGDKTIQGIGGGLCQVSTTLFRAAFNYGLPIVERHEHAYRVYYYERTANAVLDPRLSGLDASVYFPLLDMKFTNDTPYWILMETYVNESASSLQWKFYSTDVDRYVEWDTSGFTNVIEPGPPEYRENPELPSGTVNQVDYAIEGSDISIERYVYQDGIVHIHDRFDTHYDAWSDLYEYGPGTEGMPPEDKEAAAEK